MEKKPFLAILLIMSLSIMYLHGCLSKQSVQSSQDINIYQLFCYDVADNEGPPQKPKPPPPPMPDKPPKYAA